jgi:hypothetical protein
LNLFKFFLIPHFGRVRKRLQLINIYPNHEVIITTLSACAEDHELCPWMNAQNIVEYSRTEALLLRRISPPGDNPPKL